MRRSLLAAVAVCALAFAATASAALQPGVFDPTNSGCVVATYSHGVLHHIPDIDAAVSEVHRVLRPKGRAIIMLYHRQSLNYLEILTIRRALAVAQDNGLALAELANELHYKLPRLRLLLGERELRPELRLV